MNYQAPSRPISFLYPAGADETSDQEFQVKPIAPSQNASRAKSPDVKARSLPARLTPEYSRAIDEARDEIEIWVNEGGAGDDVGL
jgi:hypothetical protein